jgi:hypothetical protein
MFSFLLFINIIGSNTKRLFNCPVSFIFPNFTHNDETHMLLWMQLYHIHFQLTYTQVIYLLKTLFVSSTSTILFLLYTKSDFFHFSYDHGENPKEFNKKWFFEFSNVQFPSIHQHHKEQYETIIQPFPSYSKIWLIMTKRICLIVLYHIYAFPYFIPNEEIITKCMWKACIISSSV